MLDVCAICDDLVDVDHRYLPGFDKTKPVLCGGDKCLKPVDQRYLCQKCEKRCGELTQATFGDQDQTECLACEKCIAYS